MQNILDHFRLKREQEDHETIVEGVNTGVEFRGTNLWILVFAIFIASLGLNVNSTAVVIGAMLVSPLMGPIIGLGLGMAVNDLALLRKAFSNYLFALGVGLATSTVYFALSPLSDASSEILSRTSPNIYDVLIALFGGFAGMLAVSSKNKGNVIPGVAIATALMPPLCTAGFGIAHWNLTYLFGALYLFLINTVFIALATLVTARFLKFPYKHLPEKGDERFAQRIVWVVVLATLVPSIYFGYDIVQQARFKQRADRFVAAEAVFPNDYLLKKIVDGKKREITLTYGGEFISEDRIAALNKKLPVYDLDGSKLTVQQGFSYLNDAGSKSDAAADQSKQLTAVINEKERSIQGLQAQLAEIKARDDLGEQVFQEIKTQFPQVNSCILEQATNHTTGEEEKIWIAIISSDRTLTESDRSKIEDLLKVRLKVEKLIAEFPATVQTVPAKKPG